MSNQSYTTDMSNQSYSPKMSEDENNYNGSDNLDYDGFCLFHNNQSVVDVIGPYVHSIICILGLVGNSLVIVTYAFYKRTKSMTDIYLFNVAIADLLFVLALPFIVYNELWSWPMGQVACKLLRGSYSVNLYSGMLLLACISTDRYIAIVQARRSFRLRSPSYSRIICAIIWIFAILMSVPTFYFYNWYEPSHTKGLMLDDDNQTQIQSSTPEYVCAFKFEDTKRAQEVKVAIPSTQISVGFFLPLFIMIFCYSAIIVTLLKAKNLQRHRAVRVVLVVVAVFIICHLLQHSAAVRHGKPVSGKPMWRGRHNGDSPDSVADHCLHALLPEPTAVRLCGSELQEPLQKDLQRPVVSWKEVHGPTPLLQSHLRLLHVLHSALDGWVQQQWRFFHHVKTFMG